jgi:CheY-like chemotaxis protein
MSTASQSIGEAAERTARPSKQILVLGRSPEVQKNLRQPLLALGVSARFSTEAERAAELFDAHDFDLIVFGYGIVGPLSERLRREFTRQDPNAAFLEAFAPVAIRQIAAELERSGRSQQYVADFKVMDVDPDLLLRATILQPCTVRVEVYRTPGAPSPAIDLVDQFEAPPGVFERRIEAAYRTHGYIIVMTLDEKELLLFRMSSPS